MRRSLAPLLIEFLSYRLALPASSVLHHTLVQGKTFVHLGAATLNPRFHPSVKDNIATPLIRAVICSFFYTIRAFLTNPQEMRARTTTVHRFVWYFSLPLHDVHSSCYASFSRVKCPPIDFWDMPRNLLFAASEAVVPDGPRGRFLGMSQKSTYGNRAATEDYPVAALR